MNKKQIITLLAALIIMIVIFVGFEWEITKLHIVHNIIPKIPSFKMSLTYLRNFLMAVVLLLGILFTYFFRTKHK